MEASQLFVINPAEGAACSSLNANANAGGVLDASIVRHTADSLRSYLFDVEIANC